MPNEEKSIKIGYSKALLSYLTSHLEDKIITKAEDKNIILLTNLENPFSTNDSVNNNPCIPGHYDF